MLGQQDHSWLAEYLVHLRPGIGQRYWHTRGYSPSLCGADVNPSKINGDSKGRESKSHGVEE